jgi:uncharacterized membrane protein YhaH (DUF805 family)
VYWFMQSLKKYAVFSGRAQRKEYWMFALVSFVIIAVLSVTEIMLGIPPILSNIFVFAVLLPSVALGVRRLHDTGDSGWWMLIPLVSLVLAFRDGQRGENRFGPDPKAEERDHARAAGQPIS